MKNLFYILITLLSLFFGNTLYAQKNRIGVNYSLTTLDLPDDIVNNYQVNYQRNISKRLFLFSDINFIYYNGIEDLLYILPEKRRRIGLDLGLKFAIIKYKENYLKLGIGLSNWYRNDDLIKEIKFELNSVDNKPKIIDYYPVNLESNNLGFNLNSDLEISLSKKIYTEGHIKIINVYKGGIISILGLGIGVKF